MSKISIRYQRVNDAKKFYEILSNPNFIFLTAKPKNVEDEKEWLRENAKRKKNNLKWNYTILYNNKIVGGIGIRINYHRKYIGEVGYFLDENYWRKGITTQAVKLVENEGFKKLGLTRIEILMQPKNKASERVAIKCGYKKEGLLKKSIAGIDGKKKDALLYAKAS
jgi:[ribosomal protein S5]-alanine N-acetyltransferase